ncbi:uncharacterized protein NEMAJ01_0223 [Nematocida major]|uniref:uncharacterized protein n=1 Tax=Nematocida major TaxID=1912982 RepID=UPI002008AAB1|nr:uncharacterized protein NEMAJ01_0223 [Nematocida major]KAH9385327.1 hypothetical protein NEMAJ01_0223 [Nematocida major]
MKASALAIFIAIAFMHLVSDSITGNILGASEASEIEKHDPRRDPTADDTVGVLLLKILHASRTLEELMGAMYTFEAEWWNDKTPLGAWRAARKVLISMRAPIKKDSAWCDYLKGKSIREGREHFIADRVERRKCIEARKRNNWAATRLRTAFFITDVDVPEIAREVEQLRAYDLDETANYYMCFKLKKLFDEVLEKMHRTEEKAIAFQNSIVQKTWESAFDEFMNNYKGNYEARRDCVFKAASSGVTFIQKLRQNMDSVMNGHYISSKGAMDMTEMESENHFKNIRAITNFIRMADFAVGSGIFYIHEKYQHVLVLKRALQLGLDVPLSIVNSA